MPAAAQLEQRQTRISPTVFPSPSGSRTALARGWPSRVARMSRTTRGAFSGVRKP